MKDIITGIVALVVVGSLAYGGWLLKREINYSMDYEDKVIQTIEDKYEARITALETQIKLIKEGK